MSEQFGIQPSGGSTSSEAHIAHELSIKSAASVDQPKELAESVTKNLDGKHAFDSADAALRRAEQLAAAWEARSFAEEPPIIGDGLPSAQEVAAVKWAKSQEVKADELFTKGKFLAAYSAYERAADLLRTIKTEKLSFQAKRFVASLHCKGARAMLCDSKTPGATTTWACVTAEKALEFDPNNTEALFCRGQARRNSGEVHLARGDFEAVLRASPDHVEAATLLESISSLAAAPTCPVETSMSARALAAMPELVPIGVVEQRWHGSAQYLYTSSPRIARFPQQRPDELMLI